MTIQNSTQTLSPNLSQDLADSFNLTQAQSDQLKQLLNNNISESTAERIQQLGQILMLNETQISAINQLADSFQFQNNIELFNQTLIEQVANQLQSLTQNQQNIQDNAFENAQTFIQSILPVDSFRLDTIQLAAQELVNGNISGVFTNLFQSQLSKLVNQTQLNQISGAINYETLGNFTLQRFETNEDLDNYISKENYGFPGNPGVCFGFKVIEHATNDYELELIFNDLPPSWLTSLPNQKWGGADPSQQFPLLKEYGYYVNNGFSSIQNWFANILLKRKTGVNQAQIVNMIVPIKIPPVVQDNFSNLIEMTLSLFILLMYVPAIYRTVYRIVWEKSSRAKESMRMMGMSDYAYWSSWLAYYTIVNTVITTLSWAIMLLGVINKKSALMLYVLIWLFGQSMFGLILITQSMFINPRAAAITTTVVYFGTSIFSTLVDSKETSFGKKFFVLLLFPTATLDQTLTTFIKLDSTQGVNFETWGVLIYNLNVVVGFFLFIAGGLIMLLLGVYMEYVMPKTFGNRKHPCFCLGFGRKQCKGIKPTHQRPSNISLTHQEEYQFETQYLKAECFEPPSLEIQQKEQINQILKVTGLRKEYENGQKAVNGVNLKIYSDQIFVLLGHNGAGKTTTISMLTGLFGATEGTAEIFGIDIFNQMNQVRQIMGVCPQHDVLFELLTTQEHLEFFYDLKGADPNIQVKNAEIEKLMTDVGVMDKKNSLAQHLSGGNKRKLSVAIALCGDSKFVLLDEPTSGMDLQARRQLWNMLKENKKDRVIILTTHYMDEADILGDRIGIMANGKLTCLGTSIFLKSKFGIGYNLTIQKASTDTSTLIVEYLKQHLGEKVKKQSEIQSEMSIQIPHEYSSKFGEFFMGFDQNQQQLGILSYGISISTLEEVFLKVGHLEDPTHLPDAYQTRSQSDGIDLEGLSSSSLSSKEDYKSFNLQKNHNELDESFFNQLTAILFKRVSNYKRNRKAIFNESVLPALMMIFGVTLTTFYPSWRSPSRIVDVSRLPRSATPHNLLINPTPTVKSTSSVNQQLISGLPGLSKFDVSYSTNWTNTTSFQDFGQQVFDFGNQKSARPPYMYGSYQIYKADKNPQQYEFVSWVNLTSQDATGLYPQFMYESILKFATDDPDFKFKVRMTEYPPINLVKTFQQATNAATIVFMSAIAYGMIVTAIVSYLLVERISGLKHLQVISGMNLKAYWIGNFIFDYVKMQLTVGITLALFFGYDLGISAAWVTYLVLPFGLIPNCYFISYLFTVDSAAQTFTMFYQFFILGIMSTLTFALRLYPLQQKTGDILNWVLKLVPSYCIGSSLYCDTACSTLAQVRQIPGGNGAQLDPNLWGMNNIPADIIAMFVHLVLWSIVISAIELGYFSWIRFRPNQQLTLEASQLDNDVESEVERVKKQREQSFSGDIVQVSNLKKVYSVQGKRPCQYDSFVAVSNLSFALNNGECFALLGVNGAGKSTTFKSLVHEVQPTSGSIQIAGYDIQKQFMQARKLIGYCPQPNLIFETMSVMEHLFFYTRIKGIPARYRLDLVEQAIATLQLQDHRDKPAGTLSGGNKRKLCVALALVGNPPIIFLDEPSAGMDPEARRFMWEVVGKIAQKKTSAVVLTTHSMDEAEALSTKMGIMVKGGIFKCFGSAQHIRNKFGTGYVIELKIRTLLESELEFVKQILMDQNGQNLIFEREVFDEQLLTEITQQVNKLNDADRIRKAHSEINLYRCISQLCQTFKEVELIEKFGNYIRIRVQRFEKTIGSVFAIIEPMKQLYDVSEYSVSQTTLEQIFQSFADVHFTENILIFKNVDRGQANEIDLVESGGFLEQKPWNVLTCVRPQ